MKKTFAIAAFLDEVYATERSAKAIDLILGTIMDLMDGEFEKHFNGIMGEYGGPPILVEKDGSPKWSVINEMLTHADPWKMDDSVSLAFLSMTFRHKDKLSSYWPYVEKCRKRYLETGDKKRCEALLRGFI